MSAWEAAKSRPAPPARLSTAPPPSPAFKPATAGEADADRRARDLVASEAPADVAPLLNAHRALRLFAFEAAEADLVSAVAKGADDPRVVRLLEALGRRIGPASAGK